MNISVRGYTPADWFALQRIHDAARKQELALAGLQEAFLPLAIAAFREDLFDYPGLDVAVTEGEVVGFCAYTEEELAWLYVSPRHMRRGVGRTLVRHALMQQPGISSIEVLCGNLPAKALYESEGFRVKEIICGKMPGNEGFSVQVYAMTNR